MSTEPEPSFLLTRPSVVIAGYWRIGGTRGIRFSTSKRPRWLTRMLCKLLLEWEWEWEPTP